MTWNLEQTEVFRQAPSLCAYSRHTTRRYPCGWTLRLTSPMVAIMILAPSAACTFARPSRRSVCVRANQQQPSGAGPQGARPAVKASRIPTPEEDREVAHSAFMHAFQNAQPESCRIPGMQEFAGAVSPHTPWCLGQHPVLEPRVTVREERAAALTL